ncbi:ATP-binding protein [Gordonia sp. NPDC003585]|uniref:ATP-binding protein n=1 Tax=Gordonia sp. NPDC003585 TaxID=3154275 RepID=UPI00339E0D5C
MAGRDELVSTFEVLLARLSRGRTEQSMIITGLRGVGKTVVLNLFAERARESRWQVAEFEASRNDDAHFEARSSLCCAQPSSRSPRDNDGLTERIGRRPHCRPSACRRLDCLFRGMSLSRMDWQTTGTCPWTSPTSWSLSARWPVRLVEAS